MKNGVAQQGLAVKTGYWPLFRFNPLKEKGQRFVVDSKQPNVELSEFLYNENRFNTIKNNFPEKASAFYEMEVEEIKRRWEKIEALKNL